MTYCAVGCHLLHPTRYICVITQPLHLYNEMRHNHEISQTNILRLLKINILKFSMLILITNLLMNLKSISLEIILGQCKFLDENEKKIYALPF